MSEIVVLSTIARYTSDMAPDQHERDRGDGLAAWLTLLQTQSVVLDGLEADLQRERGIPVPWLEVLMQVTSAPDGKLKMQELARSVLLSKSGVSRLVDRMVEAGLIAREACATDRRIVYATATPAGRSALREALPVHADSLDRHFSTILTPAELGMLQTTLRKILDARGFAPTPCPSERPAETAPRARPPSGARR